MLANRFPRCLRQLRLQAAACAAVVGLLGSGSAGAAGITVLLADDVAAHTEFVQRLRDSQAGDGGFEVQRLTPTGTPIAQAQTNADDDSVVAGVRTRSLPPRGGAAASSTLTMAVGVAAARSAVERPGGDPLVLAMLSRLDYESLKDSPGLRRTDRRVGVLLRDPAMTDQLALIDAVLPQKRRLGVIATAESEPIVRELERAAKGWELQVEYAPDAQSLATALRRLLAHSDALIVLPDLIGESQAATLSVLRAGAGAGVPVFGASEGLVRSGGLAAAVSTPAQLARQARALGRKVAAAPGSGVQVEAAAPAAVRVNLNVARGLGLRLPSEHELTERVTTAR